MAGRTKKSTKKFEKNRLKGALERRNDVAKIKQRHQLRDKKKAKRAAQRNDDNSEDDDRKASETTSKQQFADMTVDDFFKGGFEIGHQPNTTEKVAKKSKKGEVTSKTGKRKRSDNQNDQEASGDELSAASSDSSNEDQDPTQSESQSSSDEEEDVETHQAELKALAEKDPEFYKFLKENDTELLDFAENGDLAEVDALSGGEEEETGPKKKKRKTDDSDEDDEMEDDGKEVTTDMVKKWKTAMSEQHSLRATRQIALAFRAAAHLNEDDGKVYKYTISSPDVYHEILVTALRHLPEVLNHHLPAKETVAGKVRIATESKKFKTLSPLLRSHSTSVEYLLSNLSDASTLKLTLSSLEALLPFLLPFRKVLKVLIKSVVDIWSDSSNTEATRITAFIVIRRLTVLSDSGIRETILKVLYQSFLKASRNTTVHTLSHINLMKNSLSEIWSVDMDVGYTTGYTLLRQLAIHLRAAITHPTKDGHKSIYNHQFTHSLDFFSRLLSTHCTVPSPLTPLIYPLVQLTLGTARLIPTPTFFPLRLTLIRSLLRISRSTNTYIPLAPLILEVLNSPEMRTSAKPTTLKPLDLSSPEASSILLRAATPYLHTRAYQDALGQACTDLLGEFFSIHSTSIAFPELSLPVLVLLKRWLKDVSPHAKGKSHSNSKSQVGGNKNSKVNAQVALLVQKIEANRKWVEERRASVKFKPGDREEVDRFEKEVDETKTPLGSWVDVRKKGREEREKLTKEREREAGDDSE
ncbi:MAG: Nucleolar Complex 2 protein [Cirrosporium novae-zelandiae]|nr:MAG: Nucleolar Complex 2 protein [Cirrosporium novae-zelandiae]